jgi:hypothetical protein
MRRKWILGLCLSLVVAWPAAGFAAYDHEGEQDSPKFLAVYPEKAGTKLDQCVTCHTGGSYLDEARNRTVTLGSCQWCHYTYGYDASGNIINTLNNYGKNYLANGRNEAALTAIANSDSDGDGFTNLVEINALRYPGDANDNPTKLPPPYRIYTKTEIKSLPQHSQFLLMNTSRSGDFYAEYTGVAMETLLADAGASSSATGIKVYSPDGFSITHPLEETTEPGIYHIQGTYPATVYFYDEQADQAQNPVDGWCDYSEPSNAGRTNGDLIVNPDGLKLILAYQREGGDMDPGILNDENSLDGEGPFRVVPPQKVPSPPDQSSRATNQNVKWPYVNEWDHNAGASIRTATMVRLEPLPEWATDIDTLEAGWNYVDQEWIIVYGALDAAATLNPDITINLWKAQFAGALYQGTLALWANPSDSAGLYWKLTAIGLSPDTDSAVENVTVDTAGTITIPDITYYGTHYVVTLTLFQNPADQAALYWKLDTISAK